MPVRDKNAPAIKLKNDTSSLPVNPYILWRLLFISQNAIGRLRDLELAKLGITPEQSGALQLLGRNNGKSTITQMSEEWFRQRNSVSTLIDRMSKQGLVKKTKLPRRRELEIEITPKGQALFNRIRDSGTVLETVFSDFSEEEQEQLAQHLRTALLRARQLLDSNP